VHARAGLALERVAHEGRRRRVRSYVRVREGCGCMRVGVVSPCIKPGACVHWRADRLGGRPAGRRGGPPGLPRCVLECVSPFVMVCSLK
jgi:hypothetical protein